MAEFLYWGQVQQRLTAHADETGAAYSFFDAVRELWQEGAAAEAEQLPVVPFEQWDGQDMDEFKALCDRTPVALEWLVRRFRQNVSATKAAEAIITPEVIPLRIACDQVSGFHRHDYFEIDYVMAGRASLETKGQSHPLVQGEFCFLSPGLRHDVLAGRGSVVISITIPGVTVENTLFRLLSRESVLSDFFHAALNGERAGHLILRATGELAVREIIRDLFHGWFYRAEYAKEIAPSYLGKQIKAATGKNYTDIVRELRIGEARRLLRTTALTMDEVADAVGYESRVQFFRSFRADAGMTPGEYRKSKTGA